jgi:hypothetical protein
MPYVNWVISLVVAVGDVYFVEKGAADTPPWQWL